MSANESTPAVSLREARQREADAEEVMYYYPWPGNREKHAAARRATDEALVRAVMEYVKCWEVMLENGGVVSYNRNGDTLDPAGVLDAVEREEAGR